MVDKHFDADMCKTLTKADMERCAEAITKLLLATMQDQSELPVSTDAYDAVMTIIDAADAMATEDIMSEREKDEIANRARKAFLFLLGFGHDTERTENWENGIELKFNGFCKGCQHADLDVIELDIFGFGAQPLSSDNYRVACKHFAKCNEWNELKNVQDELRKYCKNDVQATYESWQLHSKTDSRGSREANVNYYQE